MRNVTVAMYNFQKAKPESYEKRLFTLVKELEGVETEELVERILEWGCKDFLWATALAEVTDPRTGRVYNVFSEEFRSLMQEFVEDEGWFRKYTGRLAEHFLGLVTNEKYVRFHGENLVANMKRELGMKDREHSPVVGETLDEAELYAAMVKCLVETVGEEGNAKDAMKVYAEYLEEAMGLYEAEMGSAAPARCKNVMKRLSGKKTKETKEQILARVYGSWVGA